MAKDAEKKDGGSSMVILLSAVLALGAGAGVYYCYVEAGKAEAELTRAKNEYRQMAGWKKPVEDFLRKNKGKTTTPEAAVDPMVFLDKKAREAQIPPGAVTFAKTPTVNLASWTETVYTATMTSKDPIKKSQVVDFIRKVESERSTMKVRALQLGYTGDDFKNATITFSHFIPK